MVKKYSTLTLIRGLADKQVQPSLKCTEINAYRKIALSYLSCSSSTVPGRGCTAMWIAGMMLIKEIRKLYNIDINAEYFFFDDRKTAMNVDDLSRGKNILLKKVGVQSPVGAKRHQGLGHSNPTDIVKQKDRGDETLYKMLKIGFPRKHIVLGDRARRKIMALSQPFSQVSRSITWHTTEDRLTATRPDKL